MVFGIEIGDKSLLELALKHSSCAGANYERLEFLGDAVLKLIISDILYKKYPDFREGDMSKIRSIVVSDQMLGEIASEIGLDKEIELGEEKLRGSHSIGACAFEAVLGAYWLDGKFTQLYAALEKLFAPYIDDAANNPLKYNAKAVLQEYTQEKTKEIPLYEIVEESGPAHDKVFTVEVSYQNKVLARGQGHSKKEAEQSAALKACEVLGC